MENEEPTKKNEENMEEDLPQIGDEIVEPVDEFPETKITEELGELQNTEDELEPITTEQSGIETDDQNITIDQAVENEKEINEPEKTSDVEPQAKMPKWLQKGLIYFGVAFLLLLAGFLIAYFTTTQPAKQAYQTSVSDLLSTENELTTLRNQYKQLDVDLENTKNELSDLSTAHLALNQDFEALVISSEFDKNLASLKYEIANARYYLLNEDKISARQVVILAKGYFDSIKTELDPDIATGIEERISNIQKSINSDPEQALDELRTLMENLERISIQ